MILDFPKNYAPEYPIQGLFLNCLVFFTLQLFWPPFWNVANYFLLHKILDRGQLGTGIVWGNVPRWMSLGWWYKKILVKYCKRKLKTFLNIKGKVKHLLKKTVRELEASVTTEIDMLRPLFLFQLTLGLFFCNLYGAHIKSRHINSLPW